jgi:two-component system NtrC family sensor kinase
MSRRASWGFGGGDQWRSPLPIPGRSWPAHFPLIFRSFRIYPIAPGARALGSGRGEPRWHCTVFYATATATLTKILRHRLRFRGDRRNPLNRLGIAWKIGLGYGTALAIAVAGPLLGMAVGDRYQRAAERNLQRIDHQQELLSRLETTSLKLQSHPSQLMEALGDPIWFRYHIGDFRIQRMRLDELLDELTLGVEQLAQGAAASATVDPTADPIAGSTVGLEDVSPTAIASRVLAMQRRYRIVMERFQQEMDRLRQGIEAQGDADQKRQRMFQWISSETAAELRLEWSNLSEDLTLLLQRVERQQGMAYGQLERSQGVRAALTLGALVAALAVAILWAIAVSRTIAAPIERVAIAAAQVTEASDFSLRVPVVGQDEVAQVSRALNQLIQWMGDYSQQLRDSNTLLEGRVEERTAELKAALRDLQQTQSQLLQSEKLSSLGVMVAGIAHEINNPVTFIEGNLDHVTQHAQDLLAVIDQQQAWWAQLPDSLRPDPPPWQAAAAEVPYIREDFPQLVRSMRAGSQRITAIVTSLRNFSRLDEAALKTVDLHEGLNSTLLLLNHRIQGRVALGLRLGELPRLTCYPAKLNQVFLNLLTNALDALDEGAIAAPALEVSTQDLGHGQVCVRISDNGPGISEENQRRLFDPFFTTKPVGKGTGLGLSLVYRIVQEHGGTIQVRSRPGAGAVFSVYLPVTVPELGARASLGSAGS